LKSEGTSLSKWWAQVQTDVEEAKTTTHRAAGDGNMVGQEEGRKIIN